MTKQEIITRMEACINALQDVDIPARLANTSGRTLSNVCATLIQCGRGVAELKIVQEQEAEADHTEDDGNG